MRQLFLIGILLTAGIGIQAQDSGTISIGIKTGLNFAKIAGPSERSSTDQRLESNSVITRFMLAPTIRYALTDVNGFIIEAQYSQKGGNYEYVGESYWVAEDWAAEPLYFEGNRSVTLNINNGYIDIPILYYQNINSNVSFYGGGYIGFLLNSSGAGNWTFNPSARPLGFAGTEVDLLPLNIELEHNYKKDMHRDSTVYLSSNVFAEGAAGPIPGFTVPQKVGAYYDYAERTDNFYKNIDAGIIAGIDYKFDSGLGIGFRANYGLVDITNNVYDYSKLSGADPDNNDFSRVLRTDRDRNLVFQLYIGFEL